MSVLVGGALAVAITATFVACFYAANHLGPEDQGRVTSRGPR